MPEKDYTRWLEHGLLTARRFTEGGKTIAFRVVFLSEIGGTIHCITRYDTAHGFAHRDVLGLTEGLRGKLPVPMVSYSQAFEYAVRDIKRNENNYLADFLAH